MRYPMPPYRDLRVMNYASVCLAAVATIYCLLVFFLRRSV